jgi:hypothetical protein
MTSLNARIRVVDTRGNGSKPASLTRGTALQA